MRTPTRKILIPAFLAVLSLGGAAHAETFVTLDEPEAYELQAVGFELESQTELQIDAVGMDSRHHSGLELNWFSRDEGEDRLDVYAWILDAETREPVWFMRRQNTERGSGSLRSVEEKLTLQPGRYEVYLFSGLTWFGGAREEESDSRRRDRDGDSWWERMFMGRGQTLDEVERDLRDCQVKISRSGQTGQTGQAARRQVPRFEVTGELPGALIRHAQVGDSDFRTTGFELDKPSRLRIRALIEGDRDNEEAADYGWIVNAATREVVWQAEPRRSERGGGGRKNRLVDVERAFEPGRYLLYYGTDDSHSFDEFNANPPYDPLNWGISVLPGEGFDPQSFRTFTPGALTAPLIDFSRSGDNATHQQGFRLHTGGELHIVALGEYAGEGFADLAWVTDAGGRTLWEMEHRNTRGAGGSAKNRMFDGLVSFSAGDYVLYYTSDGSHSYDEYNAAKPFEPQNWGVTVRSGPGFSARNFELISLSDLAQSGDIVAQLIGVGDDDRQRRSFSLDRDTVLSVYALGEGQGRRMHDYGWIVDESSGERVWEMEYADTEHAGGADKNRRFDGQVRLKAGSYVLVYETDGSHAFGAWNAGSPRDPFNWGITLRREP